MNVFRMVAYILKTLTTTFVYTWIINENDAPLIWGVKVEYERNYDVGIALGC